MKEDGKEEEGMKGVKEGEEEREDGMLHVLRN